MPISDFQVVLYYSKDKEHEPERIGSFNCENYAEMVRLLHFCKNYEVPIEIRNDAELFNPKVLEKMFEGTAVIDDYNLRLGDENCMQCIDVYMS